MIKQSKYLTGVISGNSVNSIFWDTVTGDYINHNYDVYMNNNCTLVGICEDSPEWYKISEEYVECGDTWLYGYIKKPNGDYVEDTTKEFSCIINNNENTIQVTQSEFFGECYHCSPCYPNQGDLDTPGYLLAYHLPPELHDSNVRSQLIQE